MTLHQKITQDIYRYQNNQVQSITWGPIRARLCEAYPVHSRDIVHARIWNVIRRGISHVPHTYLAL